MHSNYFEIDSETALGTKFAPPYECRKGIYR